MRKFTIVAFAAAALCAGSAPAQSEQPVSTTTFVFNGRGWGHGVGMSQYGALGFARRGVDYRKILAHFYRGTTIGRAPVSRMRVLLAESRASVTISSTAAFGVRAADGRVLPLAAGAYTLTAKLELPLGEAGAPVALPGPLRFVPTTRPLVVDRPYRGALVVHVSGKRLHLVNDVGLEQYIAGVVSDEMPHDWPLEAVKAQAVAARSYAIAQRRTGGIFDVYADVRDQVYGGVAAQTATGNRATLETKGEVVMFGEKVATTFFFSTSGGRTADVRDAFVGAQPTPYLVSVPDPYDSISPYHRWGPVVLTAARVSRALEIAGVVDLQPAPSKGRARSVVVDARNGDFTLPASHVRRALDLRSTWFTPSVLTLAASARQVAPGTALTLTASVKRAESVTLEQRVGTGAWGAGPPLEPATDGVYTALVAPEVTTQYRLVLGTARGIAVRVVVR